jgi:hypothetical protein
MYVVMFSELRSNRWHDCLNLALHGRSVRCIPEMRVWGASKSVLIVTRSLGESEASSTVRKWSTFPGNDIQPPPRRDRGISRKVYNLDSRDIHINTKHSGYSM